MIFNATNITIFSYLDAIYHDYCNFFEFFRQKIWYVRKSAYLCNRNQQTNDSVAQLVEQMTLNHWVESSSLSGGHKAAADVVAAFYLSFFATSPNQPQLE